MKTSILKHSIAALLLAVPIAQADDKKPEEKKDAGNSASASTSVVASADGTATVTIDINGKKETRTFKLGDGNKAFSWSTSGDGNAVAGGVGVGGGVHLGKKEKGPWLGIAMEPVAEVVRAQLSLAPGEGVVVNHVAPDSPAAKAGLVGNDILLRFEDQIVVEPSQLQKLIAMKKPGDSVKLTYLRKGERKEANATLMEHEIEVGAHNGMRWFSKEWGSPGLEGQVGRLQEQLKQLKDNHPGIIVDKKSWLSGPGGHGIWNRDQMKDTLDNLQKQLDKMNLPKEEAEKIRKEVEEAKKNAEEAMEKAKKAFDDAMKAVKRPRADGERKDAEPPKKPGEPL